MVRAAEMRYLGQNYSVDIELDTKKGALTPQGLESSLVAFHAERKRLYGYDIPGEIVELIHFRVTAIGETDKPQLAKLPGAGAGRPKGTRPVYFRGEGDWLEALIYDRRDIPIRTIISGPAIVEEPMPTTLVHPEQTVTVDDYGNLVIQVGS